MSYSSHAAQPKDPCDSKSSSDTIALKQTVLWDTVTSRNCEIAKLSHTLPPKFLSRLSRPIEVCVAKGIAWNLAQMSYMQDMIPGAPIRYTLKDVDTPNSLNDVFIIPRPGKTTDAKELAALSRYFDQPSEQLFRGLGISYIPQGVQGGHAAQVNIPIYLVKPAPSDSGPMYIALSPDDDVKKDPVWYTISAPPPLDPKAKTAWEYITSFPSNPTPTSNRFYTFLGNSTKYMNLCCSSPDTQPYLSTVCANTNSMYNKEPLSGLPSPQCDSRMRELCAIKSEANDPICACINRPDPSMMGQTLSEYTTKTLKLPDKCTSGTCNVKLSYVPASLRRQICPNICSSIVEVDSDGYSTVEMDDIHVGVECNKKSGDPSLSSMVSTTMSGNGGTKYRDQWVLYVLVAVIVILVILLIFLYTSYKFRDE